MIVIPNSEVRLLNAVPLNNSYEHQLKFNNVTEQTSFFYNKTFWVGSDLTYQRADSTIKVPRGRDSLYACNYIMYRNTEFSGKWFYGFITEKEYVNPEVTAIHFEIDVYQTWQFEMQFKTSFVEREHARRWNADGTPVVNTVDEGLDYGSEYETVSIENWQPFDTIFFLVVVAKNAMHGGTAVAGKPKPMVNGSPQPLSYYIHPFKLDGTSPKTTVAGMDISISPIDEFLTGMYTITGAQNNIVSIYVTEHIGYNPSYSGGTLGFDGVKISHAGIQDASKTVNTLYVEKLTTYETYIKSMGPKYKDFASVTESKLLMYPYAVTNLVDFKGNHIELKNEYIDGATLSLTCRGSLGTSNKVAYSVVDYKTRPLSDTTDRNMVSLENSLINSSANDVPILTDMLSAYLQGNRNQLENQRNSILFSSVADIVGNMMGGIGSAMGGNPVGSVSAASGMIQAPVSAYFQLQGMMAKRQDLKNTPPSISNMGGNTAFDYGNRLKGVYVVKKQITPEYRKKLTDYFKMFGYKLNELKVPNLKTRQHYNFIKTVGANIMGNIPQDDLQKIRSMFDVGVTLWHGDWVGDYSLSNGEV